MMIARLDEQAIFNAARRIESPEARRQYLRDSCGGDAELLTRVEALLRVYDEQQSFLQTAAGGLRVIGNRPVAERLGTVIGPYKLLEQIGEGGYGVVFMAEQQQPIKRKVALKVLKPGMDTRQVVARFEAERQALALMDHPHIAHVFDGGTTEAGRPYFVMELVRGVTITEFCDERRLGIRQRLELFVDVCQAVQHAHQKGIIHRDIKPTNVMVTLHDGQPVVKVIDFGIAKALSQQLTDKTLVTNFAQMIGTPLYMSPEQAEMSGLDVDTRSDIYSLGVLLYELLTGTTPFENERLRQVGYDEMRRIIREEEPPKPSTRIGTVGKLAATASQKRQGERCKLSRLVRGELDWIVMKALEKDRNRRYETASALAAEVRSYLQDEPVRAGPPTAGYRLWKLLRRHRGSAAAVCVVLIVLMGGIATTSVGFLSARAAQRRAEESQRAAEENFEIAKNAVDDYLNKVTEDPELKRTDFNAMRKKLLESAVPFYQRLVDRKPGDAAQEAARGQAYSRLGNLRRQVGETAQALADFEQMRSVFAKLAANFPAVVDYHSELAVSQTNLGNVLFSLGRNDEAEAAYRAALAIWEKLAADFPAVPEYRENLAATRNRLGLLMASLGKRDEAETAYRGALAIYEKLAAADTAVSEYRDAANRNTLGLLLDDLGQRDEAEAAYRAALAAQEKLAADFPTVPEYRDNLATTRYKLGLLLAALRRHEEAEAAYRAALGIWERLAADFPSVPEYRRNRATAGNKLGLLLAGVGKYDEAEAAYRAALPIHEKLAAEFPIVPEFRFLLAHTLNNLGWLLHKARKSDQAEAPHRAAIAIYEKLVADFPTVPKYREHLAKTRHNLGTLLADLGKRDEAEAALRDALVIREQLAADFPAKPEYRKMLAGTRSNLAAILARQSKLDEAEAAHRAALTILEKLAADFPTVSEYREMLAWTACQLAFFLAERGDVSGYRECCRTMLSCSGKDTGPVRAWAFVRACLLLPGGIADPEELAPLIKTVRSRDEKDGLYQWVLFAQGLHDYRCGRFVEARTICVESREQTTVPAVAAMARTVEAMSLYRLEKTEEARQALAAAGPLLQEAPPKLDGDLGGILYDWLCCRILRREAEELLENPATETPPSGFAPAER